MPRNGSLPGRMYSMKSRYLFVFLAGWHLPALGAHSHRLYDPPRFIEMADTLHRGTASREVLRFSGKNASVEHRLEMLVDREDEPLLFYATINTPVCIDNICKPVRITLFWNLMGIYVGYGTPMDYPLTKFDHEEFEAKDYEKLHRLLRDRHSVLNTHEMSDLFDLNATPGKRVKYQGIEVDAVTGATRKEIQASVVEGALYSCYAFWHLAHGEVVNSIKRYLDSICTSTLTRRFLQSEDETYQFYALKQMNDTAFVQEIVRVTEIFAEAEPIIRIYILKRISGTLLAEQDVTTRLYELFPTVDINTRTLLIKKASFASPIAIELLSAHFAKMTKNQFKLVLAVLTDHPECLTPLVASRLWDAGQAKDYAYSYLAREFLESRGGLP